VRSPSPIDQLADRYANTLINKICGDAFLETFEGGAGAIAAVISRQGLRVAIDDPQNGSLMQHLF
jgi:hypothetical protein